MARAAAARRVAVCAAVCVGLLTAHGGATAEDPKGDLQARTAALRTSLEEIDAKLAAAMTAYERARDAETLAIHEGFEASKRADEAAAAHEAAAAAAADRIRALYMSGGRLAVVATIVEAPTLHDAFSRYENVSAVIAADQRRVDGLNTAALAAERAREAQRDTAHKTVEAARKARQAAGQVEELLAKQASLLVEVDGELRAILQAEARAKRDAALAALARQQQAELLARQAAQRAGAPGTTTTTPTAGSIPGAYPGPGGTVACPVGPVNSFVDTWHAPRSGGRLHQGTDVFAPHGSPAYAVADGVIDKWGNGGLGGITLWLRADNGDRFYYAHNSVNLATVGTRVKAGEVIARVGNTGNAITTPPHIHFEAHPGGGAAQNPYPFLKAVCG